MSSTSETLDNCYGCNSICNYCLNMSDNSFRRAIVERNQTSLNNIFQNNPNLIYQNSLIECQYNDPKIKLSPLEWYGQNHDLTMIDFIIVSSQKYNINFNIITDQFKDFILDNLIIVKYLFLAKFPFSHGDICKIINWNSNDTHTQSLVRNIIVNNPLCCYSINPTDGDSILHDMARLSCKELIVPILKINPTLLCYNNLNKECPLEIALDLSGDSKESLDFLTQIIKYYKINTFKLNRNGILVDYVNIFPNILKFKDKASAEEFLEIYKFPKIIKVINNKIIQLDTLEILSIYQNYEINEIKNNWICNSIISLDTPIEADKILDIEESDEYSEDSLELV